MMAINLILKELRKNVEDRARLDAQLRREMMRYPQNHPDRKYAEYDVEYASKLADQSAEALAILEAHVKARGAA